MKGAEKKPNIAIAAICVRSASVALRNRHATSNFLDDGHKALENPE
jgi:hypothetical protein